MLERAYLDDARSGTGLSRVREEVARLTGLFREAGAILVDPPALLPADALLDLYGEDIRARAFITGEHGVEQVLRPDFTVPIVQRHMAVGAEPARYAYAGPVWRRQEAGSARAQEYLQAGFELFDGSDPAAADAEVFSLICRCLEQQDLTVATGDLGLVLAAIDALSTTEQRRAALRRHVWRPARFHRLLDRFADGQDRKADLIAAARGGDVMALIDRAGQAVGLRSAEEVAARIARLMTEAETPPLASSEVDLIEAVLDLSGTSAGALDALRDMTRDLPAMTAAVDRFAARLDALSAKGVDPDRLPFEGSYGRTTLEYYDGFVFGFLAAGRPDLPLIASGGRYDTLTRVLGGGKGIPAIGAIIRPEAALALEGSQ